jgi:NADH-quinone oxidoreductase subunit G
MSVNWFKRIGALTSKPYKFNARSWELNFFHSVDFFDSVGSNVKIEMRGKKILRVLPLQNDFINQNWITDKARFAFDSFLIQRLGSVYKKNINNTLIKSNWNFAFNLLKIEFLFFQFFKKFGKWSINFFGIADPFMSVEQLVLFKDFLNSFGTSNLITNPSFYYYPDITFRNNFLLKVRLNNLNSYDCCILLNCNPRIESPIFNLRLRQNFIHNNLSLYSFGVISNPIFNVLNLGNNIMSFVLFMEGKHLFNLKFLKYIKSIFILGFSIIKRLDSFFFFKLINYVSQFINFSFFLLYDKMSNLSAFDLGFIPGVHSNYYRFNNLINKFNYNIILNINNSNLKIKSKLVTNCHSYVEYALQDFNIFNGAFGFKNLYQYDLVLPLNILLESTGSFLNIEGKYDIIPLLLSTYKEARWSSFIFNRVLLKKKKNNFLFNFQLPFSMTVSARLKQISFFFNSSYLNFYYVKLSNIKTIYGYLFNNFFLNFDFNFFVNDVYSLNSPLMHKVLKNNSNFNFF